MASSTSKLQASVWHKLRQCTWQERKLLVEAAVWLALFAVAIRFIAFKRLAFWLNLTQLPPGAKNVSTVQANALIIGWAVRVASRYTPWKNTCLVQAVTGAQMLRRRGIASTLTLGVAVTSKDNKRLNAHAWLQQGSDFLTGEVGYEQFIPISTFVCRPPF